MQTIILFFLLLVLLTGCRHINYYNPKTLPQSQLVTIHSEDVSSYPLNYRIRAAIIEVEDANGQSIISTNNWIGSHDHITLPQGEYTFRLKCSTRFVYNFHDIPMEIKSGEAYVAYCLGSYDILQTVFGEEDIITHMIGFISKRDDFILSKAANQNFMNRLIR